MRIPVEPSEVAPDTGSTDAEMFYQDSIESDMRRHMQGFLGWGRSITSRNPYPQPRRKHESSASTSAPLTTQQLRDMHTALRTKYSSEASKPVPPSSPVKDETPFNVACALGHSDVVKALDDAGARRNIISSCGMSALHIAAANGHAKVVEYLLSKPDVDKELHAFDMNTALHLACAAGRVETVKVMIYAFLGYMLSFCTHFQFAHAMN